MDTNKIQMTAKVAEAINGELRYQNKMAGTCRADEHDNGLPGQILAMEDYLQTCRTTWARSKGNDGCLHDLRKVVATGVRALERFGCPTREGEEGFRMLLQNINHSFDVKMGDVGVTIRKGDKWSKVPVGTTLELWRCTQAHAGIPCHTDMGCQFCGEGITLGSWYGQMGVLPDALLAMEHNVDARNYSVLMGMMQDAYGEDFDETADVTALIYQRLWATGQEGS
jgi:hypothetical protein